MEERERISIDEREREREREPENLSLSMGERKPGGKNFPRLFGLPRIPSGQPGCQVHIYIVKSLFLFFFLFF